MAIEVKKPGSTITAIQDAVLREIDHAGGMALIATSVDDVAQALEAMEAPPGVPSSYREIPKPCGNVFLPEMAH